MAFRRWVTHFERSELARHRLAENCCGALLGDTRGGGKVISGPSKSWIVSSDRCAGAANRCRISGGEAMRAIRWRTSACRRFPCSSCRARRSWRTSAVWTRDRAGRIARRCSAWTRFSATIISGRCWIRSAPDHFHPAFAEVVAELEGSGGLEAFRQLGGHVLIALDGTEYHVSGKDHSQQCSTRKRGKDKIELCIPTKSATGFQPEAGPVPGSSPISVHKHGENFHAARRRFRSRSYLARPYICRFNTFSLLICPSTGLVLHGSVRAARTAA